MYKRKKDLVVVVVVLLLFILLSYPLNGWLSSTMPRHQIIQLPAMFVLGLFTGLSFSGIVIKETSWGIAALIFIMASFVFWMLPHSIDEAVINPAINRVMHANMLVAGFLLMPALRNIVFEIKILFLGMLAAMVLATGIALRAFDILLCSSFSIDQQKDTGLYLMIIGFLLFVVTFVVFFKAAGGRKK